MKSAFKIFKKKALAQAKVNQTELATDMASEMRETIETQALYVKPLNEKYLNDKIAKGKDPRILMSSKEFVNSIGIKDNKKGSIEIGVDSDAIHSEADMKMRKLQRLHENGTKTIPARPMWRRIHVALKKGMKQ